jgi:DNA-binding IclR family transcriptional regulator
MDDHTVIGRAVAILDCIASAAGPLALAALTRRTGIPKPTVRRIANDLTKRGMLELTSDGYQPATRRHADRD